MGDIIAQWLREKLGILVNVHDDAFLHMVLNGQVIAMLLRQYNVITEEQLQLLNLTCDPEANMRRVILWLKMLDPSLEEDARNCFMKAKLSSVVKLFYKLYIVLKGKDQLHFTTLNAIKQRYRASSRFECSKVPETITDPTDVGPHPLSYPLQEYHHIIQWHKDRYNALLQRCKDARNTYIASLGLKEKPIQDHKFNPVAASISETSDIEADTADTDSIYETYDQLKDQEAYAKEMEVMDPNPQEAANIVKKLKQKYRQDQKERTMKVQMETILVTKIWNETVRQQEQAIEMELSKKILKQSNYEKQMAAKVFEIREQKYIMAENRNLIQREIQKKIDDSLLEYVFAKEKQTGDERYRYYFERERALELHRRIYDEKQRLKIQRRHDMCEDIVSDLVDIAIKEAEFELAFDEEMPLKMKNDLAALFVEGKSIFDIIDDTEAIIDYAPITDEEEELLMEEIDRQNTIDIRNFKDYCDFQWPFEVEAHTPDYLDYLSDIEAAMNILGHIIFRLLLTKYPKPPLPKPPDIPKVDTAVCLANIPDLTILPILEKLLFDRKIRIIQMEEAINYCLDAYKKEITTDAPESQFVDETQKALEETKKKKGKDKGKKDKKGKKNVKPKGQKSKGKSKKKGPDDLDESVLDVPLFKDEMLQTPRIFPCEEPSLSPQAELGRLAYEVLNLGEPISDQILVKMFVEYLKTVHDIYGWALINYPQTFDQAALLEEALTAKPVPIAHSQSIIEDVVPTVVPMDSQEEDNATATETTTYLDKNDESFATSNDEPARPTTASEIMWNRSVEMKVVSFVDYSEIADVANVDTMACEQFDSHLDDIADLEFRDVLQNYITDDKNAEFRVSLLLTNPDVVPIEEDFDCYLTAFIKLSQDALEPVPNPHVIDEEEEIDCLTPLDIFYQNQGCHYTLYYKVLDFAAIKHLGKLILGDYSIPPKTSVQIFGDTVLYLEADMPQPDTIHDTRDQKKGKKKEKKPKPEKKDNKSSKSEDKKGKKDKKEKGDKKGKKEKKEKKEKKGKKGKISPDAEVAIERADKETQIPTPPVESVIEFIEIPEPLPGRVGYVYVDLSIPEFFQTSLATLWENVEEIYVYDFRELFFRKRLLWKSVIPYTDFVKRYMRDYIARPDDKQIYVFTFQKIYNAIDEDMRDDDELKAELHCRIYEFREKLWEICDQRMREAEEERQNVIVQDWVAKQACELTNIYITAMQLEIDRCCDTMQLLNDYYTGMVTKMPCQGEILPKALLDQIRLSAEMEFENSHIYREFVRDMLKTKNSVDDLYNTPYHGTVRNDLDIALNNAAVFEEASMKEIAKMNAYVQPGKKAKPSKDKGGKGDKKWPKFTDPEPDVKEQGPKLIQEWTVAIQGEKLRVMLRLNMLMSVFCEDIKDMFNCSNATFHGLFNEIRERYENEMKSVEKCCSVLSRAVEEEMSIQPALVLKGDRFYINPDVLLFEDPLPLTVDITQEYQQPEAFTIDQILRITEIFMVLAPKGIMPEQAFLYLLQDIIVHNADDGAKSMVPRIWKELDYQSMNALTFSFFGKVEMVDWRDFIIYNLCISFPTEEELMSMRRQFREMDDNANEFVYDYQYNSVKFWFEKEFDKTNPQDLCRLANIKALLCRMFQLEDETVNYTALLLSFCKAENTPEGVAKALALSLGKLVCHEVDIGEGFVETLRERKMQQLQEELEYQMQEKEKLDTVTEIIESLVDTTVHECDSCNLEELKSDEQIPKSPPDEFATQSMQYLEKLMQDYPVDQFDEYEYDNFLCEDFSNVEIGYEAYRNPPKAYYLPFEVLLTVMMSAMPWHAISQNIGEYSFRERLEKVYDEVKNKEFDDVVLTHEFLNSVQFEELMKDNFKFVVRNPRKVIRCLLDLDMV